jgi:GNAT superfamily N-acetyltransferase
VDRLIWYAAAGAVGWPPDHPAAPPFDPTVLPRHRPDAHAQLLRDGRRAGQLSLWWSEAPPLPGERVGAVGHFGAADEAAARALLDAAVARLRAEGCTLAVGPLDGNTWRRYRLVTETGGAPPFLLEPTNPRSWPRWWAQAGFSAVARYGSAAFDLADLEPGPGRAAEAALAGEEVTFRTLQADRFETELARIHQASRAAFRAALLYTPLPEAAFLEQYRALRPLVRPDLVQLAERGDELLGFVFAVPDALERERGVPATTVVAKTIAVRPEWAGRRLGTALITRAHEAARAAGYRRVIHALFHLDSPSRRLGGDRGRPLRRYALLGRRTGA